MKLLQVAAVAAFLGRAAARKRMHERLDLAMDVMRTGGRRGWEAKLKKLDSETDEAVVHAAHAVAWFFGGPALREAAELGTLTLKAWRDRDARTEEGAKH